MRGDLGTRAGEVHAQAKAILAFWFEELSPDQWFARDEALDAAIARRFGEIRDDLIATDAVGWRGNPGNLLAAIIAIDQFSRNIHRGEAAAFAGDTLARELAFAAIAEGWDTALDPQQRMFAYMPLMHGEDRAVQATSLRLFEELGIDDALKSARDHHAVIARFGRFPSRNAALSRQSTPEEQAYLSRPDVRF